MKRCAADRSVTLPILVASLGLWTACEVEWGGGKLSLEDPSPPPDTTAIVVEPGEPELPPLPNGPLLYLAALTANGSARLTPIAQIGDSLAAIDIPPTLSEAYRALFDSTFLAPGLELELHAAGRRIGSLVTGSDISAGDAACPSVTSAMALALPGQALPEYAVAFPNGVGPVDPELIVSLEPARSMSIAGPVLAERLMDDERSFLARRVALKAVSLPPDTAAAMAATYLVDDSLAVGPPGEQAISLFFLARWEASRGYIPVWQEVRRYDSAEDKEVFEHLDWFRTNATRIDVLRLFEGSRVRLVASVLPADGPQDRRTIDWVEGERCPALARLGS